MFVAMVLTLVPLSVLASTPPTLTSSDISEMDTTPIFDVKSGDISFYHSAGFTSRINDVGDMFLVRSFSAVSRGAENWTLINLRQIDCTLGMQRSISGSFQFNGETTELGEGEWKSFSDSSVERRSCIKAEIDRAGVADY